MPLVTCPECQVRFDPATAVACPTCGWRARAGAASSRRPPDDVRPGRRRSSRNEDEDEDDRRVRRNRRESGNSMLLPLILVGGGLVLLLAIGGIGLVAYLSTSRAVEQERAARAEAEAARAQAEVARALAEAQRQASAKPVEQPRSQPPAGPPPGSQPPVGLPPGFPPPPTRPPIGQPPSAMGVQVTLSNLRRVRGFGAREDLELTYEYTSGNFSPFTDVLIVETTDGTSSVRLTGFPVQKRTVVISSIGLGGFRGPIKVWMERSTGPGPPGARGTRISNELTLN